MKSNLNEAEYEVDRRRYLFAHEAESQQQSLVDIRARLAARSNVHSGPVPESNVVSAGCRP